MTMNDFIRILGESLQDSMPIGEVRENVQYYREYISGEIQSGRSEESVLEELGDPRLIAKTILDAKGYSDNFQGDHFGSTYDNRETYSSYREPETHYQQNTYDSGYSNVHVKRFDKWYHKLIIMAIIVAVLVVGFTLIAGVISLLLHFAVPVLLIYLVYRVAKAILNG